MSFASGRAAEKAIEPHRVLPRREGEQGTQGQIRGGVVAPARWRVARPERVLAVLVFRSRSHVNEPRDDEGPCG